jgi:hypothetical protein
MTWLASDSKSLTPLEHPTERLDDRSIEGEAGGQLKQDGAELFLERGYLIEEFIRGFAAAHKPSVVRQRPWGLD